MARLWPLRRFCRPLRFAGSGDRRDKVEAEILGRILVADFDQPLQVPQVVGAAAGMLDALDVEIGAEMVVNRDPGCLGHGFAAALAEVEVAGELGAGDAVPAQTAGNPSPGLVEMIDRRWRRQPAQRSAPRRMIDAAVPRESETPKTSRSSAHIRFTGISRATER